MNRRIEIIHNCQIFNYYYLLYYLYVRVCHIFLHFSLKMRKHNTIVSWRHMYIRKLIECLITVQITEAHLTKIWVNVFWKLYRFSRAITRRSTRSFTRRMFFLASKWSAADAIRPRCALFASRGSLSDHTSGTREGDRWQTIDKSCRGRSPPLRIDSDHSARRIVTRTRFQIPARWNTAQ